MLISRPREGLFVRPGEVFGGPLGVDLRPLESLIQDTEEVRYKAPGCCGFTGGMVEGQNAQFLTKSKSYKRDT